MPDLPGKEKRRELWSAALLVGRLTISVQTVIIRPATVLLARIGRCPSSHPGRCRGQQSIRRIPRKPPWCKAQTPAVRRVPSAACPFGRGSGRETRSCNSAYKAQAAGRYRAAPCATRGRTCAGLRVGIAMDHGADHEGGVDHLAETELLREVIRSAEQVHRRRLAFEQPLHACEQHAI